MWLELNMRKRLAIDFLNPEKRKEEYDSQPWYKCTEKYADVKVNLIKLDKALETDFLINSLDLIALW